LKRKSILINTTCRNLDDTMREEVPIEQKEKVANPGSGDAFIL